MYIVYMDEKKNKFADIISSNDKIITLYGRVLKYGVCALIKYSISSRFKTATYKCLQRTLEQFTTVQISRYYYLLLRLESIFDMVVVIRKHDLQQKLFTYFVQNTAYTRPLTHAVFLTRANRKAKKPKPFNVRTV